MLNALGIDVEEWYHLCGLNMPSGLSSDYESRVVKNTEKILQLLDVSKTKATFFILGVIAERFPELVRKIDERGHEIASHGYRHLELFNHSPDSFKEDLKKSLHILESITGKPVLGYRAPGFSITTGSLWAIDILVQAGIKYDCSIFPIRHPRYGIRSASPLPYCIRPDLIEFPPSTIRFLGENLPIAGGAYLRILPFTLIKTAMENLNNHDIAVNTYLHVWEMDDEQPKLKIPMSRRFTHYAGIKKTQLKFENLLTHFRYVPINQVIQDGRFR